LLGRSRARCAFPVRSARRNGKIRSDGHEDSLTDGAEISDLIVDFDAQTLARVPVRKHEVVEKFRVAGNHRAARIVAAMPERDGVLDPDAADDLLVRVHCEMQRIAEEFQHGQRVVELLRPLLAALRDHDVPLPLRIVDVGCGTGYVLRWLAARGRLGPDVELVGADYNRALVDEASRLAAAEQLDARFVNANVFALREPATVFLTTGVIHHFRGPHLVEFFRQHDQPRASAFLHFDFQPSPLAPFGAWLFHAVRMREPLARHDGVLSAVRAHTASTLLAAAREGAPGFRTAMYGTRLWGLPIPRSFHTLVGLRPALADAFVRRLGPRANRLGPLA
jgi:SAM-dependent methyltransferase